MKVHIADVPGEYELEIEGDKTTLNGDRVEFDPGALEALQNGEQVQFRLVTEDAIYLWEMEAA